MTKEERDKLKEMMAKRIIKAEKKVANYEDMSKPVKPENSIGRLSRMDAINNKSVFEAALSRAREELEALKEAIEKVYDEDFGKCRKCNCQIPMGRIVLTPGNPYCVKCAV